MATKKTEPVLTEVTVSYSVGVKAQLVKYELTSDSHLSRTERWSVEGMSVEEVNALWRERFDALKLDLDDQISAEYDEMMQSVSK